MSDTPRTGWYERLTDAAKTHGTTRLKILLGNIASQTPQPSPEVRVMMRESGLRRLVEELERDLAAANADNARLREALAPFAHDEFQMALGGNVEGNASILWARNKASLILGDFRRARAALEGKR